MRFRVVAAMLLSYLVVLAPAHANNGAVEQELKTRPDLSVFYQALVNTGVINELRSGPYTIFAPTNEALARLTPKDYPCFYSEQCRAQTAQVLRNHIVHGNYYVEDIAKKAGGITSVNDRLIRVGKVSPASYTVDSHPVISANTHRVGVLYKIDGIIVNGKELAMLRGAQYGVAGNETVEIKTISETTIPDPACGPKGCPDSLSQEIITTRTVMDPAVLAPAR